MTRNPKLDAFKIRAGEDIAEIQSDRAHWLVVEVEPGQEGVAAAHLIARGFGIFVPGHYIKGRWVSLLTDYLFVCVFGIEAHRERVLSCPGVADFLYQNGHPSCPYVVSDQFIDAMRRHERKSLSEREQQVRAIAAGIPRKRRRSRKSLRIRQRKNSQQAAA
jgi:hypothetical protein